MVRAPCEKLVRPNSPPQITRVSSNRPLCFKSFIKVSCTRCHYQDETVSKIYTHYLTAHLNFLWCNECDKLFSSQVTFYTHLQEAHFNVHEPVQFQVHNTVLNRHFIKRATFAEDEEKSIELCIYVRQKDEIRRELDNFLETYNNHIKVSFTAHCLFEKI